MKKLIYLFVFIALLFTCAEGKAQPGITGYTTVSDPSDCSYIRLQFTTAFFSVGSTAKLFLNGTVCDSVVTLTTAPFGGRVDFTQHIYLPGNYTFKITLTDSVSTLYDSLTSSITKLHCGFSTSGLYHDANLDCILDAGEQPITNPALVEISSGGIPIDTIYGYSNFSFMNNGIAGTVYAYRLLQPPMGFTLSCPAGGVIYDTVGLLNIPKRFAFVCSSTTGFDLQGYVWTACGPNQFRTVATLKNNYCTPVAGNYTIFMSPKYEFLASASTAPVSSSSPLVVTWALPILAAGGSTNVTALFKRPSGTFFAPGDTVTSRYELTPLSGDINPSNNIIVRVDTVRLGYDPNDIAVHPPGNIAAGTELEYIVRFENTGNAPAYNIYVMDTLPNEVDFGSLSVVASSHNMNIVNYSSGGHNIIKFDFPNINLLDSSHHGLCDGMVVFKVKTKASLTHGTQVHNNAGIYFDYNPVVMTNTVINTIVIPTEASSTDHVPGISVYPNPVHDILTVTTGTNRYNTAIMTNAIGQVVVSQELNAASAQFDVKHLSPGIYFLYLKGEAGSQVQRFEKQ